MFIDETVISTHMIRRHGRGLSGDRVVDHETLGSWNTHALIAAIRPTGWSAAMVLKGVADADAFATDLEECVVPTLKPDEIVVLDNVSSRHDGRIRPLIQSTGAKLYDLLPHSAGLGSDRERVLGLEGGTQPPGSEDVRGTGPNGGPTARQHPR